MHNLLLNLTVVFILFLLVLRCLNYLIMKKRRDVLQVSKEIYLDGSRDLFYDKIFFDIKEEHSLTKVALLNFIDKSLISFKTVALQDKKKIIDSLKISTENFVDQDFYNEDIQTLFIYVYSLGELLSIKDYVKNSDTIIYNKNDLLNLKNVVEQPSISSFYEGRDFLLK